MEWVFDRSIDNLPLIAGGFVAVIFTGLALYFGIRHKFPVKVNCWFCNKNSEVPYGNRNCWDCPHCEQYNGFEADGSYNKAIPAQHNELLNHPVHAVSSTLGAEAAGNGLCRKCNINQELKVQQLASFTPFNPMRFDEEVDQFRHHLERVYRLCSPCEGILKRTLHKQKSMFLGMRLKQSSSKTSHSKKDLISICRNKLYRFIPLWVTVARYLTAFLAAVLVLSASSHLSPEEFPIFETVQNFTWSYIPSVNHLYPQITEILTLIVSHEVLLTAIGVLVQFVATFGRKHEPIDIISVGMWTLLHMQCWIALWSQLETYISLLDFNIIHVGVALITSFMCTCSALIPRRRFQVKYYRSPDRNLSSSSESSFGLSSSPEFSPTSEHCQPASNENRNKIPIGDERPDDVRSVYSNSTMYRSSPISHRGKTKTSSPVYINPKPSQSFSPISITPKPTHSFSSLTNTLMPTASFPNHNWNFSTEVRPGRNFSPMNRSSHIETTSDNDDDLDHGIGKLTLGTSGSSEWMAGKPSTPASFETKVYGSNVCSDIFEGGPYTNLRSRKRSLLRPSQLNIRKNMTQSSWVAGGYWQCPSHQGGFQPPRSEVPEMAAGFVPLSRSSSQSSGFVSQSSHTQLYDGIAASLPHSRSASISGVDFDRFSALSEPIYPYATTPVYFANSRPGPYLVIPHAYSMIPPGYPIPQPRPVITPLYYPQLKHPSSSIWKQGALKSLPNESKLHLPSPDVLSRSSSQSSIASNSSKTDEDHAKPYILAASDVKGAHASHCLIL